MAGRRGRRVRLADISSDSGPSGNLVPVLYRALYVPALAPLGGAAEAVYRTNPAWALIGVALLALRYRRTDGTSRRQIRWLHVNAIFTKLGLSAAQISHRRVTAVLTFLRDAGLRG